MRAEKKKKLEAAGWSVYEDATDFLGLSPAEKAYVELKVKLAEAVKRNRERREWTQAQLAKKLASSQSRVAKIEAGDPSVSLDLCFRSLFALGTSRIELAKIVQSKPKLSGRKARKQEEQREEVRV